MPPLWLLLLAPFLQEKDPATTKEAMRRIQLVVGEWRVTVQPDSSAEEAWTETQEWDYRIDKEDYALRFTTKDAKRFKEGNLAYDLQKKVYRLQAVRADGAKAVFEGTLTGKDLTLEQVVEKGAARERLTYTLLRHNRFLIALERQEAGGKAWLLAYTFGCTKEGVPFAQNEGPKCVVTGGTGTISVQNGGKTYYVCCNSCKTEFTRDPKKTLETAKKEGWIK